MQCNNSVVKEEIGWIFECDLQLRDRPSTPNFFKYRSTIC